MHIALGSSDSYANGHPVDQYRWLQENAPVYWHEYPTSGGGFWALTRFDDVRAVSRDRQRFTSEQGTFIFDLDPALMAAAGKMILLMDAPRHTAARGLVQSAFTRRAVLGMQSRADQIAREIVDSVCERGECDLVAEATGVMPLYFMADLLGFPREEALSLYADIAVANGASDTVTETQRLESAQRIFDFGLRVMEQKRAQPGDDICSGLLEAGIPADEFVAAFWLLLDAGGDTVRHATAAGVLAFIEHPDAWERLRADLDGRLANAVEEVIRWSAPVTYMARRAKEDLEIRGQQIRAGDKVAIFYGAANHDPEVFPDHDVFDIARSPNPHVSFGAGGPHLCLGAALARMEIAALLREIAQRMPDVRLSGAVEWAPSYYIIGPEHMPVAFTATPVGSRLSVTV
jgi:cytochrome P450